MDIALKQRIIGALIIIGLAIVFIPSILDGPVIDSQQLVLDVPPRPELIPYKVDSARYEQLVTEVEAQIPRDQAQDIATEADAVDEPDNAQAATKQIATKQIVTKQIPAAISKPSLNPVWTVQLGSFTQINNAKELEAKLQKNKLKGYMKKINTDNGIRYRVYVGPEIRQADANAVVKQLQKKFGLSGLVVKYRVDS